MARIKNNKKQTIIVTVLCLVCFGVGVLVPVIYQRASSSSSDSKLEYVKNVLENDWYYADQVEDLDSLLTEQALTGMTTLDIDPHTNYFSLDQAKQFSSSLQGTNTGIGIQFYQQDNGNIYVKYVFINSTADDAGLKSGDIITKIGDLDLASSTTDDIVTYIQDRDGKEIAVDYVRDGQTASVKLTPSEYDSTVICNIYDGYGEIILSSFSSHSGDDVADAMARLKEAGITKMILDLRNNTGGYLSAAVEIASTFLPSDSVVFYEEDKDKNITEVKTDDSYGQIEMDQIVILQNDQTASASEALIGALKSHLKDKVTLVGQTTYGKGTEQTTVPFEDGTSIKYTIARWLTPDKESIHERGFEPDVAVEDTSIGSVSYTEMKEDDVIIADKVHVNASALQRFLEYLGYTVDRTDEYFSKTSSDSLKQFQKDQGIAPTGNCDYTTWEKILDMITRKYNENSVNDDPIRNNGIELLG